MADDRTSTAASSLSGDTVPQHVAQSAEKEADSNRDHRIVD